MTKTKIKFFLLLIVFIIGIVLFQTDVKASNENIQIIKKDAQTYIIYIKDNENTNFMYAFSNDKNIDKSLLNFTNARKDSNEENAKNVVGIDKDTTNYNYLWVRDGENYILECVEVDISKAINAEELQYATTITKIIKSDLTKTHTTVKEENGKKITTTLGEIVIEDENGEYSYICIKLPNSEEYNSLMKLARKISKFNNETDLYTQIETYRDFLNLFNILKPASESAWIKVEKNVIYQPDDAEDGDEYIVWIKNDKTEDIDVQFLTSSKKYSEEKVKEIITSNLPITYDNNILLVVFAVIIVLIVAVIIRIRNLSKKES